MVDATAIRLDNSEHISSLRQGPREGGIMFGNFAHLRVLARAAMMASTLCPLGAAAAEFIDPPVTPPPRGGGDLIVTARRGDADLPGFGFVKDAAIYDIGSRRAPHIHARLLPPIIAVERDSTLRILLRNELTAASATAPRIRFGAETNLHTHGLTVAPTGVGFAGGTPIYGDCVFVLATSADQDGPSGHAHGNTTRQDPCAPGAPSIASEKGSVRYSYPIAPDHPSGLYWFHPHPHGQSEPQLANGASGMLTIGRLWDYAYINCRITAAPDETFPRPCATQEEQRVEKELEAEADKGAVRMRYLGLKDIQAARAPGDKFFHLIEFPARPEIVRPYRPLDPKTDAQTIKALQAFGDAADARKNLCGDLTIDEATGEVSAKQSQTTLGQCGLNIADPKAKLKNPDARWLFTVSGQVYPHISFAAGKSEIWRIANLSADVTYRLRLETEGSSRGSIKMTVLARDGVALPSEATGTTEPGADGAPAPKPGPGDEDIVLMPSARIEILVRRCDPTEKSAGSLHCLAPETPIVGRLRTIGMATGADASAGDQWPAIDLASITFEGASGSARKGGMRIKTIGYRAPRQTTASPAGPTEKAAAKESPAAQKKSAAKALECNFGKYRAGPIDSTLEGNVVRLVRFNNIDFGANDPNNPDLPNEHFGLHVENFAMVDEAAGSPISVKSLIAEAKTPQKPAPARTLIGRVGLADPCQSAAIDMSAESNLFGEDFDQYYAPFDMAKINATAKYGAEEYWLLVNDSDECHNFHIHQTKFAVVDADFVSHDGGSSSQDRCLGDRRVIRPIDGPPALQDNYPLPPYARVLLRLRFDGPKLGRFVFHCHILEHEDKGMMAAIEVVQ
ncbi:multicopper oxidase domain-containing protein [Methylocapsa acidiphila]|uniref:multicopper oxidase domain-containing protein n=1 Tax=Methylocapsa acidiphila TaxID=133552 RepID=UPI0004119972|nr:multicopper oxidase domain-containing protein [Methylocapsa acidiphila]